MQKLAASIFKQLSLKNRQNEHFGVENELEDEDRLVWLSDGCYLLPEIIQFLKENPRPAHREVYPRVEVYDDDTYWGEQGYKTKPLKVLKNVNLLELLEALKEFAPEYAR